MPDLRQFRYHRSTSSQQFRKTPDSVEVGMPDEHPFGIRCSWREPTKADANILFHLLAEVKPRGNGVVCWHKEGVILDEHHFQVNIAILLAIGMPITHSRAKIAVIGMLQHAVQVEDIANDSCRSNLKLVASGDVEGVIESLISSIHRRVHVVANRSVPDAAMISDSPIPMLTVVAEADPWQVEI